MEIKKAKKRQKLQRERATELGKHRSFQNVFFFKEREKGKKEHKMPKRKRKEEDELKEKVKYFGVYKNRERFQAKISIDRKIQSFGTFDTPKEAAKAYDRAAIQEGRPTSKLNFLDQVLKNYKP